MNVIRNSMEGIRASEELKKNTLRYLEKHQNRPGGSGAHVRIKYVFAAICVLFLLGTGGYSAYIRPVSYVSIDVNPSIELGINQFGRVVKTSAYQETGQEVLAHVSLNHLMYLEAIGQLLENNAFRRYIKEDSLLMITIISDNQDRMMEEIEADEILQRYGVMAYTSDTTCMEEAHAHEMSFGKYRACLELLQYDESVTLEDCHGMTMREIRNRTEGCMGGKEETSLEGTGTGTTGTGGLHHEGHHGH